MSECALKHVPSGIYSLCRVFRKKVLWMYSNKLTSLSGGGALSDLSLLVVLDIRDNEFTRLPSDIMCLASLKVLLLKSNKLNYLRFLNYFLIVYISGTLFTRQQYSKTAK